jgi:hypothetical protein
MIVLSMGGKKAFFALTHQHGDIGAVELPAKIASFSAFPYVCPEPVLAK